MTTVLNHKLDRAWENLYEIAFDCSAVDSKNPGFTVINQRLQNMKYYAERVAFGGDFQMETEYSEATKQFFIKNAQRVKTVSLTLTETSTYQVFDVMKDWMNNVYNFTDNVFNRYDPRGTMYVNLDASNDQTQGSPGVITVNETYPTIIPLPGYDWASGNPITHSITFSCSGISFHIPNT